MQDFCGVTPLVSHRQCGGYIAHSPAGEALKLGTTASSEAAATENFRRIFAGCKTDLSGEQRVNVSTMLPVAGRSPRPCWCGT